MKKIIIAVPKGWSSVNMGFEDNQIILTFETNTGATMPVSVPVPVSEISGGMYFHKPGVKRHRLHGVAKSTHSRLPDGRSSTLAILQMLHNDQIVAYNDIIGALVAQGLSPKTPQCRLSELRIAGFIEVAGGLVSITSNGLFRMRRLEKIWHQSQRPVAR